MWFRIAEYCGMATLPPGPELLPAGHLRSVTKALQVIEVLAAAERGLSITEIAGRLGLGRSTTHRLLSTLVASGFACQEPDRCYRGGPTLARMRAQPVRPPLLRDVARPVLRWLAQATGESTHLAVMDGTSVIAIDHESGVRPGDVDHAIGAPMPAHATAVGLALLAHHPTLADAVLAAGLDRWTMLTDVDEATFRDKLDTGVRRGYAVNLRGWLERTAGVAAPVLLDGRGAVAAVGISGPAERVGRRTTISELGPLVRAAARDLGARLAEAPPPHLR